ncbi:MAG: isocitrate lyase/PEP mutase family protein [Henriciella sp.]
MIGPGRLDDLWSSDRALLVPGITDMVSVKLARAAGFETLFFSGYWCAASRFGLPDAGIVGYAQFLDQVRAALETEPVDLIADADTGFGSLTNLKACVQGYEAAGVRAIQVEDQQFPKRCAISGASDVVDLDEMLARIAVIVDHRKSSAFKLIARTDAMPEQGLQAAIDRGCRFVEAGADLVFVEGVKTEDDLKTLSAAIEAPLVYNYTPGSGLKDTTPDRLAELGVKVALAPSEAALAGAAAMQTAYRSLAVGDYDAIHAQRGISLKEISAMVGLDAANAIEDHYKSD